MCQQPVVDKDKLHDELREAFIQYQFRLDYPFPQPNETWQMMVRKYQSDIVFRSKVSSLVGGVMLILNKHL